MRRSKNKKRFIPKENGGELLFYIHFASVSNRAGKKRQNLVNVT